jgi:hypothetical protein
MPDMLKRFCLQRGILLRSNQVLTLFIDVIRSLGAPLFSRLLHAPSLMEREIGAGPLSSLPSIVLSLTSAFFSTLIFIPSLRSLLVLFLSPSSCRGVCNQQPLHVSFQMDLRSQHAPRLPDLGLSTMLAVYFVLALSLVVLKPRFSLLPIAEKSE